MQRVRVQTADGLRELWFIRDSAEYSAAREDGEIHIGDDIIYKAHLVEIIDDFEMLILDAIRMGNFGGFGGFGPVMPDMDANGNTWSFTVNGQPVTQEQFNAAMGGTPRK